METALVYYSGKCYNMVNTITISCAIYGKKIRAEALIPVSLFVGLDDLPKRCFLLIGQSSPSVEQFPQLRC